MKNELSTTLKEELESNNIQYDNKQKSSFFGRFSSKPEAFRFDKGELKQILASVKFVKNTVDQPEENSNIKYFTNEKIVIDKNKRSHRKNLCNSVFGLIYGNIHHAGCGLAVGAVMKNNETDKLRDKLFEKTANVFGKYPHLLAKREWDKSMIQISTTENGFKGVISCIYCEKSDRFSEVAVYCRSGNDANWINSNLISHINRRHNSNSNQSKEKIPSKNSDYENVAPSNDNLTDADWPDGDSLFPDMGNFDSANISSTTINLKIEHVERNRDSENPSDNAFDDTIEVDFEEIMLSQISQQIERMNDAVSQNGEETKCVYFGKGNIIANRNVVIREAEKDGNCLFSSLCHQIYYHPVGSEEHETQWIKLRNDVVKHIQKNFNDYVQYLKSRVYNLNSEVEEDMLHTECRKFLDELSKPYTWGGIETIRAVGEIFKVNIVVINDDKTCNMPCAFNSEYEKCVLVYFSIVGGTVRNHYDSVIGVSKPLGKKMFNMLVESEKKRDEFKNISCIEI